MDVLVKSMPLWLLLLLSPTEVLAWNMFGHMVIGNIAYQHLQPAIKKKVDNIVAHLHEEYPKTNTYQLLSSWPDSIRSQHIYAYSHWHYIQNGFSTDGTPIQHKLYSDNAVWALQTMQKVIGNNRVNIYERARLLAFFTHIVGDLHQPLHTVTRVSAHRHSGDLGGNLYFITYNKQRVSLHKFWDGGLGLFEGTSSPERVEDIAKQITALYPEAGFGSKIKDLDYTHWTTDGMKVAKTVAYNTIQDQIPTNAYVAAGQQQVEQETALAGYRLAELINRQLAD